MRIGILTFHRSINNGAVMQAYALSKRLKQDYPNDDVEIVDYHMPSIDKRYDISLGEFFSGASFLTFCKKAMFLARNSGYLRWNQERKKAFEKCLKILPLSDEICDETSNRLFKYLNEHYDVLIVGSDAVWNYEARGFPNAYFPDKTVNCLKLSYAASCYGMDFLKATEENREKIEDILNGFLFAGVRDQATEDFVKWSGARIQVVHTCDPTALLDTDDLPVDNNEILQKLQSKGFDFSRETIGVMGNADMLRMIRAIYGNRYQIVALYNYLKGADVNLHDLTPYEWAYVFRFFKLTFTTFSHLLIVPGLLVNCGFVWATCVME